ncbi:alanyl-tRNA editing protein [Tumebacillus permanentifrigoris]|uniref:Alanine--tRNA ligase n=1 Tax=Tumebacillus permanentifrigoris TaxID=378543 RepID=A0A316DAR6_9BACL|nr:DHHA1 domain-containing protein [Tumebacillus permanentifrigoris]PWK13922.1 alanyl-tRNA synthetase [Tumebacillus permanentifrigoris]
MTGKLYYDDPYLRRFTATVTESGVDANGMPYVVLDRTAYYPTGGGQPSDQGTLNGLHVVDVEEVAGQVRHRLARGVDLETLPVGTTVEGEIEWERRFDHMQQHTGQHILSAAFEELYNGATVGFHLGREVVTVDIALPDLSPVIIEAVEALANRIVFENRPIDARFVAPEELAALPLRKAPSVTENIRIVTIRDFDYSPCGGTHPARTGEVGPIKLLGYERYKGNVRIQFVCGWRTLKAMTEKQQILRQLSRHLTSGEGELPDKIERLLTERKELERSLQDMKQQFLFAEAETWLDAALSKRGILLVARTFEERPMQELQRLAQRMAELEPSVVVLLVSAGAKLQLVFSRGTAVGLDMSNVLKSVLPLINGKGGGSPTLAQGGGVTELSAHEVLDDALQKLEIELVQISGI